MASFPEGYVSLVAQRRLTKHTYRNASAVSDHIQYLVHDVKNLNVTEEQITGIKQVTKEKNYYLIQHTLNYLPNKQ